MAKNPQKKSIPTKKHLARLEKERIQRRYILIGSGIVILLVFGLILYGLLDQYYLSAQRPVAVINGEKITSEEFEGQTRYARYNMVVQAYNIYELSQLMGDNQNALSSIAGQLQQINNQLFPEAAGQQVIDQMVDNLLIRQEAEKMGISVSIEEIDKEVEEAFGYYPNGTPTPQPTTELKPTSTLSQLQKSLLPATLTSTPSSTPSLSETPALEITPTVNQQVPATESDNSGATPAEETDTVTPTDLPTPTPFTEELFNELYKTTINNLQESNKISEEIIRQSFIANLYLKKVQDKITEDLDCSEEQVWALHILVEDEELAKDIKKRLDEGEDWTLMAATYSTDASNKNNGGDLGWFGRGAMVAEFEEAAFDLEIGETSDPVQTEFGWHIIRKIGQEEKELPESGCQQLRQTKFTEWLSGIRDNAEITINDNWRNNLPTEPGLPDELLRFINANQVLMVTPTP